LSTARGKVGGLVILPPLSAERERELLPVIARGREARRRLDTKGLDAVERRRLRRLTSAGDAAEATLLQSTCGLVKRRVNERGYHFDLEDLEAAGIEGLVNALHRFDPAKGNRFSTYAYAWITKLVNQAIRQQVGLSESDMAMVLALQKLLRSDLNHRFTTKEIAASLRITTTKAREVVDMNIRLVNQTFRTEQFDDDNAEAGVVAPSDQYREEPKWVIDELRRLCGVDFDAFWQFAHKTMSIEQIARQRGISRQAMTKRLEKCRVAVRDSAEAQRLLEWLGEQ